MALLLDALYSKIWTPQEENINIFTVAEDQNGFLTAATTTLKKNLKNWLLQYKPINDEVDILNTVIENFPADSFAKNKLDNGYKLIRVVDESKRGVTDITSYQEEYYGSLMLVKRLFQWMLTLLFLDTDL